MNTEQFGAAGRRALNQVWNGAGEYGFQPVFVSNTLYMNTVAGLAEEFFGKEALQALFDTWEGDIWQGTYDRFAWLLIEQAVYRRNLPLRPALEDLRRYYADFFLDSLERRSRSENMGKALLCESLQRAYWRKALGQSPGMLLPKEAKLYSKIRQGADLEPEALGKYILELLKSDFGFTRVQARGKHWELPQWLRFLPQRKPDVLQPQRLENAVLSEMNSGTQKRRGWGSQRKGGKDDLAYVEGCFGRCRYSPNRLEEIRQKLCTGAHAGCALWFTDGAAASVSKEDARRVFQEALRQQKKNKQHYLDNAAMYEGIVRRIQREISGNLLSEYLPRSELAPWLISTQRK